MTESQARWAQDHDWHLSAHLAGPQGEYGWSVRVGEVTEMPDGSEHYEELVFNDYQQLREWAGY